MLHDGFRIASISMDEFNTYDSYMNNNYYKKMTISYVPEYSNFMHDIGIKYFGPFVKTSKRKTYVTA